MRSFLGLLTSLSVTAIASVTVSFYQCRSGDCPAGFFTSSVRHTAIVLLVFSCARSFFALLSLLFSVDQSIHLGLSAAALGTVLGSSFLWNREFFLLFLLILDLLGVVFDLKLEPRHKVKKAKVRHGASAAAVLL